MRLNFQKRNMKEKAATLVATGKQLFIIMLNLN